MKFNKVIIAITGASGSVYAKHLINNLQNIDDISEISLIFSENGKKVWNYELDNEKIISGKVKEYDINNMFSAMASGTSNYYAMVVIPCSMATIGRIANGTSDNLIIRAADVMLKENRKLILVPRESPYNLIHIRNMEKLLLCGANIIPASPSFYSKPVTISELVNTVTQKIKNNLGFTEGNYEWGK